MKKLSSSGKGHYSIIYSDMRGVDFSGDGSSVDNRRFAYAENMYKDYSGGDSDVIESIPGYRKILDTDGTVHSLFSYKNEMGESRLVIHSSERLIRLSMPGKSSQSAVVYNGVKDGASDAFFAGGKLYVIDGESFTEVSDSGINKVRYYYVPTLTVNGERYEQANLLTRVAKEKYFIGNAEDITFGTPGIKYLITDEEKKYCKIVGYEGLQRDVYVPKLARIGDTDYTVRDIGREAFAKSRITSLNIASGVVRIDTLAFYKCTELKTVTLGESVVEIGISAFADCISLEMIHLGISLKEIGQNAFSLCAAIKRVTYSGNEMEYDEIFNTEALPVVTTTFGEKKLTAKLFAPVFSPFAVLSEVELDTETVSFDTVYSDGKISGYSFFVQDKTAVTGKTLVVTGSLSAEKEDYLDSHRGFLASVYKNDGNPAGAILGCTVAASFDGRIFLTGNERYPGYVFYSEANLSGETDQLYFGEFNFFRDGDGGAANVALLPLSDSLAVFKERQDGNGSIFYHTPERTDTDYLTTVYPLSYTHSGIVAKGAVLSFSDDPIFVSDGGILALEKSSVSEKRSVACRSHNVNARLLSENLKKASLTEWQGYLAAGVDGRIYLADSRARFRHESGSYEYEWYFLSGIGSYKNDKRIYRYSSYARDGFSANEDTDSEVEGEIFSAQIGSDTVYFTEKDGVRYEVYPTEEHRGGEFYPLTKLLSIDGMLFFASSDGSVSVFNTDKRGTAPDYLKATEGFSEEEYRETWGDRIHPSFYSFAGHAPRYALKTKRDNCNLPHLLKNTVKGSLAVKFKSLGAGRLIAEAGVEGKGYREIISFPNSSLVFSDIDFSRLTLLTEDSFTSPIKERAKKWVEKQITLFTEDFASPFGIYTIAYRFEVYGYLKK